MKEMEVGQTTGGLPGVCPSCGAPNDAVTAIGEKGHIRHKPKPDDITICISCGSILVFEAGLTQRRANEEEIVNVFMENPDLYQLLRAASDRLPDMYHDAKRKAEAAELKAMESKGIQP